MERAEASGGKGNACGVRGDPRLKQEEKAKFGKRQIDRIKAAFEEAHRPDVTEERVVYARCELNETTPPGGKATIGAPQGCWDILCRVPWCRRWMLTRVITK
jgi:hypothetical protein